MNKSIKVTIKNLVKENESSGEDDGMDEEVLKRRKIRLKTQLRNYVFDIVKQEKQ